MTAATADNLDTGAVIEVLAGLLPDGAPLHEPDLGGNAWTYVKDCLDTGWVSSVGSYVDRFERMVESFTGAAHAVATVNGTAALHVALQLAGVRPGDEVIVPTLTFVATANAAAYQGAVPHFADSEPPTLGLDPRKLERYLETIAGPGADGPHNRGTGRRIGAVVCMHTFGHPVDLDPLVAVCQRFDLPLVEDAAESVGSTYKGRHTGTFGRLAILSFNGNKTITTGGGGAILTGDAELAAAARHLTTTAKAPHRWDSAHDQVGFNYRMPNLNAALGCAQMEQLPALLAAKRRLAEAYEHAFDGVAGVRFMVEPPFARSNYWLNAILLDPDRAADRDAVLAATNDAGIMTRPAWTPLHRLPMYRDCPRMDLGVAEDLYRRLVNIPSGPRLAPAADG